VIYCKCKRWFR